VKLNKNGTPKDKEAVNLTNPTSQTSKEDTYTKRGYELLQAVAASRAVYEALPEYARFTVRNYLLAHLNRTEAQIKKRYRQKYT
jgi:hypothetical protein